MSLSYPRAVWHFVRCAMVAAVVCCAAVQPGLAQNDKPPAKAGSADATDKPDAKAGPQDAAEEPGGKVPAVPARPTITNPAHIPLPGYLQFEQGFLQANASPGGNLRQFSLVQTTKLALTHHLMVQMADQPLAHTVLDASTSPLGKISGQNDTGDIQLGGQVLFTDVAEGYGLEPTVAVSYQHVVRSGTAPDIDVGGNRQGFALLASGSALGLHYDSNADFNEQTTTTSDGRTVRRAQYGQSVSVTRQITEPFSVTAEIWHFTQPFIAASRDGNAVARANAVGLLIAPAYNVRDNLVLDAGFCRGLTSTSTQWQGFAGFTYLLPRRLWPERKRERSR